MPRKKKYDGARSPYANRKIGKQVEYDVVKDLKQKGCWARRNPDYMQTKEEPIDVFCWNPHLAQFWVIQCKRHKRLLINNQAKSKLEIKNIIAYATRYSAVPYVAWRDNGLHYEILQ